MCPFNREWTKIPSYTVWLYEETAPRLCFHLCPRGAGKSRRSHHRRIRSEELEHPQIMHTSHMLTDRYGPRMTGTPNHEAAAIG